MKKLIILLFVLLPLAASSQGFFRPVTTDIFPQGADRSLASVWLVRPAVTITAMQINFNETTTVSPLSSIGTGISYSHFVDNEGEPYQNFSANLLVLFGTEIAEITPLELSIAGTISLYQYLNLGIGYNFMDKNIFLLTGIAFNFNN